MPKSRICGFFYMEKRDYRLPKVRRLRKNREFQQVYRRGKSYREQDLVLIVKKGPAGYRVGFTCGKKVGNAVVRNKVRRRMKENFRHMAYRLMGNVDLVFVARASAKDADYGRLGKTMEKLLSKAGVIQYNG